MGAYFHQDFYVVHGGVWETVQAFVADDPEGALHLPTEIRSTLERYPDEQSCESLLDELGCEYSPQPGDGGYRGWLSEIARVVEAPTPDSCA